MSRPKNHSKMISFCFGAFQQLAPTPRADRRISGFTGLENSEVSDNAPSWNCQDHSQANKTLKISDVKVTVGAAFNEISWAP